MGELRETVKFWSLPHLKNLELLHGTFIKHSFVKHIHEGFAVGVIEHGALEFTYRGEKLVAPQGFISLVIPGEAHDGHAASPAGWSYRMFYLEPQLLEQAALEISGCAKGLPFFSAGVLRDDYLARQIRQLHLLLEDPGISLIEQESQLLMLLTEFIMRHAEERIVMRRTGKENQAVKQAREYIEDNFRRNISLQDLSGLCNLSPFHLIRVFGESVGVSPHIYLKQVRVKRAKELLTRGLTLAFVAQETGFADQSHFSRHFKQITGLTPGKYSNFIQGNSL
jgi:AraC-like DNA-binding protein